MNYLLTISYHNEKIADVSYDQLVKTMINDKCKVLLLDNNYPLLKDKEYIKEICKKYGFEYHNVGYNLGLHEGYNYLIKHLPKDCTSFIAYDGDSYPITLDWHIPLLKLHNDPLVVWSSLYNYHSYGEMDQRSYRNEVIQGYNCRVPLAPVVNSICAFKTAWIKAVGGLQEPSKYYGGLEVAMWRLKQPNLKWAFLNDYKEESVPNIFDIQDVVYTQYKVAHAHKGNPLSFAEYLKTV